LARLLKVALNHRSNLRRDLLANFSRRGDLSFANTLRDSAQLGGLHTRGGYGKVNIIPRRIDCILIGESSIPAADPWVLDSAATSSDHRQVVLRLKVLVRRVWALGVKRKLRLMSFKTSNVEEFNDLVRDAVQRDTNATYLNESYIMNHAIHAQSTPASPTEAFHEHSTSRASVEAVFSSEYSLTTPKWPSLETSLQILWSKLSSLDANLQMLWSRVPLRLLGLFTPTRTAVARMVSPQQAALGAPLSSNQVLSQIGQTCWKRLFLKPAALRPWARMTHCS